MFYGPILLSLLFLGGPICGGGGLFVWGAITDFYGIRGFKLKITFYILRALMSYECRFFVQRILYKEIVLQAHNQVHDSLTYFTINICPGLLNWLGFEVTSQKYYSLKRCDKDLALLCLQIKLIFVQNSRRIGTRYSIDISVNFFCIYKSLICLQHYHGILQLPAPSKKLAPPGVYTSIQFVHRFCVKDSVSRARERSERASHKQLRCRGCCKPPGRGAP